MTALLTCGCGQAGRPSDTRAVGRFFAQTQPSLRWTLAPEHRALHIDHGTEKNIMAEWSELKAEFEALRDTMRFYRLDYQWGSAGVYYRLAGGGSSHATRRFETLADIAGRKLQELPEGILRQEVLQALDASSRWHEALRFHSGAFEFGFIGQEADDAGNHLGNIYTGTLNQPAEASALLCLQFSNVPVAVPTTPEKLGLLARVNKFLHREADQRGYLWLFIGFVVTVILALMAL